MQLHLSYVPSTDTQLVKLREDNESLKAMVRSLLLERNREKQQADQLRIEMLRLQLELERYKKWYYGPQADRLSCNGDVAQMLLEFAGELYRKPIVAEDLPPSAEPASELRRVRRRPGRRNPARLENLPVTTRVYELSEQQRVSVPAAITPGTRASASATS